MAKKVSKKPIRDTKIEKEEKFDIVCPILQVNPEFFYNNVETWFREIPIRKCYFGYNISKKAIESLKKRYPEIEIIDQKEIKTQGKALVDLMKLVKTKWFVYLHNDAELTPYCFEVLKRERKEDIGIIESNRALWDGKHTIYPNYVKAERAYSGFQLIQKKAIEDIIEKIEDDYIFRSEDLILQNFIEHNGYKYVKSYAMHIHQAESLQITNNFKTQGDKGIKESMFKSFIKYTTPSKLLIPACLISITNYLRDYGMDMYEFFSEFMNNYDHDNKWSKIILNSLTGGTSNSDFNEKSDEK